MDINALPEEFKEDIKKAVSILKEAGCSEIYIFGSLAEGKDVLLTSDIDLAVKGLPNAKYFKALADLLR